MLLTPHMVFAQITEPDISVTPDSTNFETVSVGDVRERSFAISNEGTSESLIVFALDIRGDDANQFEIVGGGGGFVLAPSELVLLTVRFIPTSVGEKRATLRIESNDPDENPLNIILVGTGQGFPDIGVSSSVVNYEAVRVGDTVIEEVFVANTGTEPLEITSPFILGTNADQFAIIDAPATITLGPQEQDSLRLSFTPTSDGEKFAELRFFSNDPDENPLNVSLLGLGISSSIAVDSSGHDFGNVVVGETVPFSFFVLNNGTANLNIDSITIGGEGADQFVLASEVAPILVGAGRNEQITFLFTPTRGGTHTAVVSIASDALGQPQLDLSLRGTGIAPRLVTSDLALDFGEVLAGFDSTRTVALTNAGLAILSVGQIWISGGDSTEFVLEEIPQPFNVGANNTLGIDVRFEPTTEGAKTSSLRIVSNDVDASVLDIPLTGVASLLGINVPRVAPAGEDVQVNITLPNDFEPVAQQLFFRMAGEQAYLSSELSGSGSVLTGTIPSSLAQISGIEYYAQISNGREVITLPPILAQDRPLFLPVRVEEIETPVVVIPWIYQLISAPLLLDEPSISSVLADDFGEYDTRRWRIFRFEGDGYVEFPDIEADFQVGNSFWLVTNDTMPFDFEAGESVDASQPMEIVLQPGWNQIGNPFAFEVAWPAQSLDPRISLPVTFSGNTFLYDQVSLQPWEGYFVQNLTPVPVSVMLGREAAGANKASSDFSESSTTPGTFGVRLGIQSSDDVLNETDMYLGFGDQAVEGHDRFDVVRVPPIGRYIRLSAMQDGMRYKRNLKPLSEGGHVWDLTLEGDLGNSFVTVDLDRHGAFPEGYDVFVFDLDRRTALLVSEGGFHVSVNRDETERNVRVVIGTSQFAEERSDRIALTPVDFGLDQNFPNPFTESTTIPYRVGEADVVRMEVFNVLGQRVRVLVNDEHEPGSHAVIWDGTNDEGVLVSSGMYFCTLEVGTFTATQKVILIR